MKTEERLERAKKVASTFLGTFVSLFLITCFLLPVASHSADLFPGRGSFMSANSSDVALPAETTSVGLTLLTPLDTAVDVSQSPSLNAVSSGYPAGAVVQYHFQIDTAQSMDSQGTTPLFDFDPTVAQTFASKGAFSGQNAAAVAANDAYTGVSTATFAFYANTGKLSPSAQYYWRVQTKTPTGSYGDWSSVYGFITGRFASATPANNLAISGTTLYGATSAGLANIGFTIAENNVSTGVSTNGGAYNTADWIFVKFSTAAGADGTWNHATLTGGTVDAGATLAAATDNRGVFLNHTAVSAYWTAGTTVTWNMAADGVALSKVRVKVFAISMVKVPTGSFVYNVSNVGGGATTGSTAYNNYSAGGTLSATITNAGLATGTGSNNLPAGAPVGWPNGYNSFYMARYETTMGQYADFLNTVHSSTAALLNIVGQGMTNSGTYPNKYVAVDPNMPRFYSSIGDIWSYLSWAGLRPPTEMEFEKAGRDLASDARVYPWGSTNPDNIAYTPINEGVVTRVRNYANFNQGTAHLDVGRYMSGDVYRTAAQTGASPWGIADLIGGVTELTFNCSYASIPANGTGTVYWPANWPAPGSTTIGERGFGLFFSWSGVELSRRTYASYTAIVRDWEVGGRGCRTP